MPRRKSRTWEHLCQSLDTKPVSLGPNTPWPKRAEAAVRLLQAHLKIMLSSTKAGTAPASLKKVTHTDNLFRPLCNCQEPDCHLRGCNTMETSVPARCRNTYVIDNQQDRHSNRPCSESSNDLQTSSGEGQSVLMAGRQIQVSFRCKKLIKKESHTHRRSNGWTRSRNSTHQGKRDTGQGG